MAKKIVDEVLNYTIIVNGDKGQKELYELEKATRKLREANRDLKNEQDRLKRAGKEGTEEYKKLTTEIKANNAAIKANEAQMSKLQDQLGITGLTMAQLSKKANELKLALRNLVPGSADYKRYEAELNKVNNRLRELRLGANQTKFSLQKLGDEFNRYQSLGVAVIASITGVVISFQKLLDYQGKLSDAQADVAKTTGLSKEAIDELTASFGMLKTRTARIELLQLAAEAGRLGKDSTADIKEFVETADQIRVALGDDFEGDINDNLRLIGKLTEQYQVGADVGASFGQGMTMIGSAINEVSASGSTQAGFLVDYISRLVGISRQANISAQDQIGFAAVLDEAGQHVETSATATSQAIIGMFRDTATYANIAGINVSDFSQLLQTDANEAFLLFLKGLNGNNEGLQQLAQKFDGLGIDGSRAISVLATLASQTDKIREKQTLANDSLYEATSLQEEFNKKNENFAAVLDRLNKKLGQLIINSSLVQWLQSAIKWFAVLVGAVDDASNSADNWRQTIIFALKALTLLTVALVSYKAAKQLSTLWTKKHTQALLLETAFEKAHLFSINAAKAATILYAAAKALLTGNITRASAAMRLFNIVVKANPIGLLVAALAAGVAAIALYSKKLTDAQKAQKTLNDVVASAKRETYEQIELVKKLLQVAKDQTKSTEERLAALTKLKSLAPQYLNDLDLEKVAYMDATVAINKYIKGLQAKAELEALATKRAELNKQLIDEQLKPIEAYTNGVEEWAYKEKYLEKISEERRAKNIAGINSEIAALDAYQLKLKNGGMLPSQTLPKSFLEYDYPGKPQQAAATTLEETPEEKAARIKREEELKREGERALDRYKALKQKVSELEREAELERMSANEREIAEIKEKYARLYQEAKGHASEIKRLQALEGEELRQATLRQQAEAAEEELKKEEETQKAIFELRKQYGLVSDAELKQLELKQLEEYYLSKLLAEEDYQKAKQAIEKKYADIDLAKKKEAKRLLSNATTPEEVEANEKRAEQLQATAQIMGNLQGAVNSLMAAELARNEVVQKAGETEEQFSKRKEAEENNRMKIMKKYARLNMLLTMGQIIADTAAAIMKVTSQLGAFALPLQISYGILGASQLAIAAAENKKIQGFEEGLYPVLDHKGRKFNAGVQTNAPTGKLTQPTILAGEKPEIIIDPLTTRHLEMNYPQVIDAIYSSAARVRGYESGHYPERSSSGVDDAVQKQLIAMMGTVIQTQAELKETLAKGIAAYYDDEGVRQMRTRLEVNNQVKQARTL